MFTWNVSVRIHSLLYTVCSLTCSYANKYLRGSLPTTTKRGMKSFQLRKWRNSHRIHPQNKNTTLESKNSNDSDLKNANTKLIRIWLENQILQIRSLGCCHSWQTLASIRTIPGTQQKIDVKKTRQTWVSWNLVILLMEEILHQLIWRISHYLQGFIHPRWCRISSINSTKAASNLTYLQLSLSVPGTCYASSIGTAKRMVPYDPQKPSLMDKVSPNQYVMSFS